MSVIIVIRHEEPEDKMVFPSARKTHKEDNRKIAKFYLPVYAIPVILDLEKTNVRGMQFPRS